MAIALLFCCSLPAVAEEIVFSIVLTEDVHCLPEEIQEFQEHIEERISNLISLGLRPDIFEDLKIEIYPAYYIPYNGSGMDEVKGYTYPASSAIRLATSSGENTFYHELGHIIHYKVLGASGYNWQNSNDLAQQYSELKNYDKKLDFRTQENLPWNQRIAEWFAEDVKHFIQEYVLEYETTSDHFKGIPERTRAVNEFMEELLIRN